MLRHFIGAESERPMPEQKRFCDYHVSQGQAFSFFMFYTIKPGFDVRRCHMPFCIFTVLHEVIIRYIDIPYTL